VQKSRPGRTAIAFYFAMQKYIAPECEAIVVLNFALPIQYSQRARGLVNNFSAICEIWCLQRLQPDFMISASS
jgi:hypothetical protein